MAITKVFAIRVRLDDRVKYVTNGEKTTYVKMTADKVAKVVTDHLVNGNVVSEYTIGNLK